MGLSPSVALRAQGIATTLLQAMRLEGGPYRFPAVSSGK